MNTTELINKANVCNTYSGPYKCTTLGSHADTGAEVTLRVNEINEAITNGDPVEVYSVGKTTECYEYVKHDSPEWNVVRVYVKKN